MGENSHPSETWVAGPSPSSVSPATLDKLILDFILYKMEGACQIKKLDLFRFMGVNRKIWFLSFRPEVHQEVTN